MHQDQSFKLYEVCLWDNMILKNIPKVPVGSHSLTNLKNLCLPLWTYASAAQNWASTKMIILVSKMFTLSSIHWILSPQVK